MAEPLLDVRGVSAGYGGTTIVRNVDLQVGRGETLVLIGPNGHGKTTLLRAITGLLPLSSGEVYLDGRRTDNRRAEELNALGLIHVPQGDMLFAEMSVEENLLMGAFPKRAWARRATELERVFTMFPQLKERRRQRARTLSGGERRQVAIGRGLMQMPRLLILDEPSLGLAPVIVDTVYATIAQIVATDVAILLVEENLAHVQDLADRVGVLEMGQIVRLGPPGEIAADRLIAGSYLGRSEA